MKVSKQNLHFKNAAYFLEHLCECYAAIFEISGDDKFHLVLFFWATFYGILFLPVRKRHSVCRWNACVPHSVVFFAFKRKTEMLLDLFGFRFSHNPYKLPQWFVYFGARRALISHYSNENAALDNFSLPQWFVLVCSCCPLNDLLNFPNLIEISALLVLLLPFLHRTYAGKPNVLQAYLHFVWFHLFAIQSIVLNFSSFFFFNFNADLMDFLEYLCEQIVCLFSFPNARSHSMFDTYVCAICSMRLCHVDSGNLNIKRNFRKIFRATNAETAAYSTRFVS